MVITHYEGTNSGGIDFEFNGQKIHTDWFENIFGELCIQLTDEQRANMSDEFYYDLIAKVEEYKDDNDLD